MNDWKVIAMASFVANVVMVILLIVAFVYTKSTITDKNEEIDKLQQAIVKGPEEKEEGVLVVENEPDNSALDESIGTNEEPLENTTDKTVDTDNLHHGFERLKNGMTDLPTEQTIVTSMDFTEAIMHYEDAYMQAEANLNNVYETLNRELSGREKANLQLDQQKWLEDLKIMQQKQLSKQDDKATLEGVKEAYTRTMARSEELLQQYNVN